ncbi:RIPOR family member 3 isoform X3 [Esox lucius]|uniref:FAM65 N-terminal domain-containing protein n=1 Tax=Esox lucius TaxID=8010 RepID=A0AAY5KF45_ESOLU|nr:RIPOR family member 3 isoform X3 [Esox lucius]
MSVKLRFECPAEGDVVQRSRSFTGFSSISGRRRVSSVRNSFRSKTVLRKSPRMHPSPTRMGASIWGQQPEQVNQIFQALRKGLKEYLDGHQAEMDFLSSQQRDTKRNSRLAFLYDLEKEIRALERYIRRLEFQISKGSATLNARPQFCGLYVGLWGATINSWGGFNSKFATMYWEEKHHVEELYEAYCIQWRLCQGALNMKKAFSLLPSSRASRESLLELSRNHRHSLEDMCILEGELEILLGELCIKMKGLIGFARLCPGDQYEVVIRLGRQRWKIRGKIQTDDKQSWDVEEMVFLPHIHENFDIKVTEVKGLGSLLVGMVTCRSADFFMSRPQLMVVDITELGTIKLQLEVVWNPFDSGDVRPITTASSRQSIHSRKGSVYSWTPPNTPSFTEKYFISMVRQLHHDPECSLVSRASRGVSLLSYLADTSQAPTPSYSQGGSQTQISLAEDLATESSPPEQQTLKGLSGTSETGDMWPLTDPDTGPSSSSTLGETNRSSLLTLRQRYSTPDILRQNGGPSPSSNPIPGKTVKGKETTPETVLIVGGGPGGEMQMRLGYKESEEAPAKPVETSSQRKAQALRISALLRGLETSLQGQESTQRELRALGNQILHLSTILKNDLSLLKSSSAETLAVEEEEVLESFDFLSTDFNADEDVSCVGSMRLKNKSSFHQSMPRSLGLFSQYSQSQEKLDVAPLTTGNYSLDQALETHLSICTLLLKAIRNSESAIVQRDILDEMLLQAEVLDRVSRLMLEKTQMSSDYEMLPKVQGQKELLMFWEECAGSKSLLCCPTDTFVKTLRKRYIHKVKAKQPGQPDAVFAQLLQQIQASCRMVPMARCTLDWITIFQLSTYLSRWSFTDLGEHISRLSKEVHLVSALESPKRRRTLKKLKGRCIAELLPLCCTLQCLADLQIDVNHKVSQAARNCLCRATSNKAFRTKAIVYYTEVLRDSDVRLQQAACLALMCLKATESVEQVAELWRSTDEDLRSAAKETVLSFGKNGHSAFQRMDNMFCVLQEEAYQNMDTEITIL